MIGYACINLTLGKKFKEPRFATLRDRGYAYYLEIIGYNLDLLLDILKWNTLNNIKLFRVTSNLVPFMVYKLFDSDWYKDELILNKFEQVREFVEENRMRITMHPSHFTNLNTNRKDVLNKSIMDLIWHYFLIYHMGGNDLITHVGGLYGNKSESIQRYIEVYRKLPDYVKNVLRLENDKNYTIGDILNINASVGIPIVFDFHHHRCYSQGELIENKLDEIIKSWHTGKPKIHISSGRKFKTDYAHADYIDKKDFAEVLYYMSKSNFDVMVEAKAKDLAVLKLINEFEMGQLL